jgi:hypothetical protein
MALADLNPGLGHLLVVSTRTGMWEVGRKAHNAVERIDPIREGHATVGLLLEPTKHFVSRSLPEHDRLLLFSGHGHHL